MHTFFHIPRRVLLAQYNRNASMLLAGLLYSNFNVVPKSSQKIHQPFDREISGAAAHEAGYVRLTPPAIGRCPVN